MNCDSIDCYHDDDYKGQWAISGTKYRLSNENIIRDGGSTALELLPLLKTTECW